LLHTTSNGTVHSNPCTQWYISYANTHLDSKFNVFVHLAVGSAGTASRSSSIVCHFVVVAVDGAIAREKTVNNNKIRMDETSRVFCFDPHGKKRSLE
jgi:hypothetical protein